VTDVELSDSEYNRYLLLLSEEELVLEAQRQDELATEAEIRNEALTELVALLEAARAAFDQTDKTFEDWVTYAAAKHVAYGEFAGLLEREGIGQDPDTG
jgi:hypothetical protein